MKRTLLIFNPRAGSLHGNLAPIRQLETELQNRGILVDSAATKAAGEATRLAARAVQERYDFLIVCGGDGTINEAAQSLVGADITLAVYPVGTANVLAKDLRITRDAKKLSQWIATGQSQTISIGLAQKPEQQWQRYFLLMAGIGLDAAMVRSVNPELKRHLGEGAYFLTAMEYLVRWPLIPFRLRVNEKEYRATYAAISNSPGYGGGFVIAPGARMDDELLNVCIINSHSRLEYLGYAALAMRGKHTGCANITYLETNLIRGEAEQETWVQLDGELVGTLPMTFQVVPEALRVVTGDGFNSISNR